MNSHHVRYITCPKVHYIVHVHGPHWICVSKIGTDLIPKREKKKKCAAKRQTKHLAGRIFLFNLPFWNKISSYFLPHEFSVGRAREQDTVLRRTWCILHDETSCIMSLGTRQYNYSHKRSIYIINYMYITFEIVMWCLTNPLIWVNSRRQKLTRRDLLGQV